jgi:uncharacterized protein YjiK
MRTQRSTSPVVGSDQGPNHLQLMRQCFQSMDAVLKRNLCGLRKSCVRADQLDWQRIQDCLPPTVQHACRSWVVHLQHCALSSEEAIASKAASEAFAFLEIHLLHWLEAMSLLQRLDEAILGIRQLESCLIDSDRRGENVLRSSSSMRAGWNFVKDTGRFIAFAEAGIRDAPLQVYSSVLIFAPEQSLVRKHFAAQLPDWVTLLGARRKEWDACSAFKGHSDKVHKVAFSPDEQTLASASEDSTVILWNTTSGEIDHILAGHTNWVNSVTFSPDGQLLASASGDCTVILWDTTSGHSRFMLQSHSDAIIMTVFSPDGLSLASASWDGTVVLWDVQSGHVKRTFEGHSDPVRAVALSPDGTILASASDDSTIILWDISTGQSKHTLQGHLEAVRSVAFSPDGETLSSASKDGTVKLWHSLTGQLWGESTHNVSKIQFSPTGAYLQTDIGDLETDALKQSSSAAKPILSYQEERLILRENWLYWGTRALLCLPPGFRPITTSSCSSTFAMGYNDGRVHLISIDIGKLLLTIDNL